MKHQVIEEIRKEVSIPVENIKLIGDLIIPPNATGLVIFSHGSGSSRFSTRNNMVARVLRDSGIGTLLFDLLTVEEDTIYSNRFDIILLTERLHLATEWIIKQPEVENLPIGYFGASTGAASALNAAAKLNSIVKAVVSRGGRPDLVLPVLDLIKAPVLLIVGGLDHQVIGLNQKAFDKLKGKKELKIIFGATHLFEESGALEKVAELSAGWFKKYLI